MVSLNNAGHPGKRYEVKTVSRLSNFGFFLFCKLYEILHCPVMASLNNGGDLEGVYDVKQFHALATWVYFCFFVNYEILHYLVVDCL